MDELANEHSRKLRLRTLLRSLSVLSENQLSWTEGIIKQFQLKPELHRNANSDIVTQCVLETFGDALQIHHCFSREPLSKDRFEFALERVLNKCLIPATLANKCNPGHDITIRGVPFSLKTQADRNIKEGFIHVSKFMELGKGKWEVEADLVGLRDRYSQHMKSYDRILQLRRLTNSETLQVYELVEIPKSLLGMAEKGKLAMMKSSNQTPKPGTCTVTDKVGGTIFQLYFDGGTERKLQIRSLDKRYCIVHGNWKIKRIPLSTEVV